MANARPVLPQTLSHGCADFWFVADEAIRSKEDRPHFCLVDIINSFHFMRRNASLVLNGGWWGRNTAMMAGYAIVLIGLAIFSPISSLDHFLWRTPKYVSNPYEAIVGHFDYATMELPEPQPG